MTLTLRQASGVALTLHERKWDISPTFRRRSTISFTSSNQDYLLQSIKRIQKKVLPNDIFLSTICIEILEETIVYRKNEDFDPIIWQKSYDSRASSSSETFFCHGKQRIGPVGCGNGLVGPRKVGERAAPGCAGSVRIRYRRTSVARMLQRLLFPCSSPAAAAAAAALSPCPAPPGSPGRTFQRRVEDGSPCCDRFPSFRWDVKAAGNVRVAFSPHSLADGMAASGVLPSDPALLPNALRRERDHTRSVGFSLGIDLGNSRTGLALGKGLAPPRPLIVSEYGPFLSSPSARFSIELLVFLSLVPGAGAGDAGAETGDPHNGDRQARGPSGGGSGLRFRVSMILSFS